MLPIFIASLVAFYVTLLGLQAFSDGGQLGGIQYAAVGAVTLITALLTALYTRQLPTTVPVGRAPPPDRFGSVARYLCESCGKPIRSQGWRCEHCGATRKTWTVPQAMMSSRARHRGVATVSEAVYTEAPRDLVIYAGSLPRRRRVAALAKAVAFVARQSGEPIESPVDLLRDLRTDPDLIRRLYWAAAKRLHPDHNDGQHLPEWFQLQRAVAVLSANPGYFRPERRARRRTP